MGWGIWQHTVYAWDAAGNLKWKYSPNDMGVDWVHTADIDGDSKREVIVGYNGGGGLHVLNPVGKLRWQNDKYGNCWCVGFARTGQHKGYVLTTEAGGRIHRFDARGTELPVFDGGAYFDKLYTASLHHPDTDEVIALGKPSTPREEWIYVFSPSGRLEWKRLLGSHRRAIISRGFAVVHLRSNRAIVLAVDSGGDIHPFGSAGAVLPVQRLAEPVVSLCAGPVINGTQLLIICTGARIAAYRVTG